MFLIKAGTTIQVEVPKSQKWFHWDSWFPYITKEDKVYDKHEVWDAIAVENGRDMPEWIRRNIVEHKKVVIQRNGKYALVHPNSIEFLD